MNTSEKIKFFRSKLGWRQKDLITAAGVSQAKMSRIDNGKITPKSEILKKIAKALKVAVIDLLPDKTINQTITVCRPQSDVEAIIIKYYVQFCKQENSDLRYALFKELLSELKKFEERKENYLAMERELDQTDN